MRGRRTTCVATMRTTARRPAWPLALLGVLALTAASCTRDVVESQPVAAPVGTAGPSTVIPKDEGSPKDGGGLVFGIDSEPDGLDPRSSQFTTAGHLVASSMLETLAIFDESRQAQPHLAAAITPSEAADRWTITVKPNITFQDGAPLDAAAVAANLDAQRQGIASIALKPIQSVTVVDDRTVVVAMSRPWASFAGILAGQPGYQMSPASLSSPDVAARPIGTGPFALDHWNRGSAVVTKKNPTYWQRGEPHLDTLEFRIVTDPETRANALASGDAQMIVTDRPQTVMSYRAKPEYKVLVDATGDAKDVTLNQGQPPFDNVNARRAVILATDRAALADTLGAGILMPTDQPFADSSAYHQPDPHYLEGDPEAAKKAVEQYTAETGKPLEFVFTTYADTANLTTAQVLQEQWARAGMKVSISTKDPTELVKLVITGNTQAAIEGNFGYPDPDFNYIFWHSTFTAPIGQLSINFPHIKNAEVDRLLDEGRGTLSPEKRQSAYKAAVRQLNDQFTYVWLYRTISGLIAAGKVHGLGRAETDGFTSYTAKGWYGDLWVDH